MDREQILEQQLRMLPGTWQAFVANGVEPGTKLILEYSFRAPTKSAADMLWSSLGRPPGRIAESRPGWRLEARTEPFAVSHDKLRAWIEMMVDAGCAYECEFDGFGAQLP